MYMYIYLYKTESPVHKFDPIPEASSPPLILEDWEESGNDIMNNKDLKSKKKGHPLALF